MIGGQPRGLAKDAFENGAAELGASEDGASANGAVGEGASAGDASVGVGPPGGDFENSASQDAAAVDPIAANLANWDERVPEHLIAYGAAAFADDRSAISGVVQEDARLMARHLPGGSIAGLDVAHVQCHIGTDTLSWSRLGARATGIDFSGAAIAAARDLAERAGLDARFVESSIADAPTVLGATFDVVYTSIGVLNWLSDLDEWARTIHALLRPGGLLWVRDVHPMLSAVDYDRDDGLLVLGEPYFNRDVPQRYDDGTSYAGDDIRLTNATTFEWPHPLSETLGALLRAGLTLTAFDEYRTLPWRALPSLVDADEGFALPEPLGDRLPLSLSVAAVRPA